MGRELWSVNSAMEARQTRYTPVQVQGLSSVVAVAAGDRHSLALKSDGTVWAWGSNDYGQLGDGTNDKHQLYSCSSAGSRFGGRRCCGLVAIVWHSKATEPSGRGEIMLMANSAMERREHRYTPVQVQGLSSVVAIAAGDEHSLAVKSDGTVWAWGLTLWPTRRWKLRSTVLPPFKSKVSVRWSPYLQVLTIVWRLKATEPFGLGGIIASGQLGDGTTTVEVLPFKFKDLGEATPEAPQWPAGDVLTVTDVTYNSVQLNWQPATDETGVDKYLVYQDNTLLDTLNGDVNSYEVKGLSPSSSYLFSLVAVDAAGNQSVKKEVTVTTAAYTAPGSFQLSDSKTYSYGGSNYEFLLYYGYISSSGQELSGSWSPPEGFHGVVNVSMGSPYGEDYDLSLETVGEGNRLPEDTTLLTDGTEYSATEVPEWLQSGVES